MKQLFTLVILIFGFSGATLAQNLTSSTANPKKMWRMTSLNVGLGIDCNNFRSMSLNELMIFAKHPEDMQRDLSLLTEDASTFTAGGVLQASLSFAPLNRATGTYRDNQEWRISIALHSPKEAMVSFKNEDLDTSIVYCNLHGEFTLETSYIFKGRWGKNFHWYAGGGLNAGLTFGNEMVLMSGKYFKPGAHPSTQESDESSRETFGAKSVYYTRLFIPYGIYYQVKERLQFGLDFRTGLGWQMIGNEKTNFIHRNGGFALGARFLFD